MSTNRLLVLVHGVPDTSALWDGLVAEISDERSSIHPVQLPGFGVPLPPDFPSTKDAYAEWLAGQIQPLVDAHGPVDIVGHDWGALLTLRAVSLNPDWFATWVVSGAVLHQSYQGHLVARIWATPVLGELFMAAAGAGRLRGGLVDQGMPAELADKEVRAWGPLMKASILKLYRSAKGLRMDGDWLDSLSRLPANGMALWGRNDPYIPLETAQLFASEHGIPIHIHDSAGHWVVAQEPSWTAEHLTNFWQTV
ncbi:MAG: alpha/beta hydrolase [Pseudomonadota bacterium]